jgi:signal transduction histidine kinase
MSIIGAAATSVPSAVAPIDPGPFVLYGLVASVLAGLAVHRLFLGHKRAKAAAVVAERMRIARELHDTLAQGLAGVGMQIDTAMRRMGEDPKRAREHIELARAMVRSSLSEVRRSIWILRAQASAEHGLAGALAESLSHLATSATVAPILTVSGEARALEPETEHGLLRIAHEAVTNAVRHSEARTIRVDVRFDADALRLRVTDDGRGFDPSARLAHGEGGHFGLVGIAERARAMGGELQVVSRPGQGTEIACRLPYRCRMVDPFELLSGGTPEEEVSL